MLSDKRIHSYFKGMESELRSNKKKVDLSSEWVNGFDTDAGVYAAFEGKKIVYVGETGKLCGRMNDLRDTRHHALRRNIGKFNFSNERGYNDANSKKKFPEKIERLVDNWLKERIKISALPMKIGRKEFEEWLFEKEELKYNKKGRRKSG